jgi:isopenicillin N synthase-like dioxygenase
MEMLSGGFYKGTIHRVTQPPIDQRGYSRVGAYYFAMPDDSTKLVPFVESPVLQRLGIERRIDDEHAPTVEEWRKGLTASYGYSALKKKDDGVEEEVIKGVVVKHYN